MTAQTPFLEIIDATFSAGEVKVFAMSGEYFELIGLPGVVDVRLVDRYGAQRGSMKQAGASFYITAGGFDAIEITSPTAQTVRFAFGTSQAGTRSSAGTVSVAGVVEQRTMAQAASMAGRGFFGKAEQVAVAGQFSFVGLWNPVDSGKRVILHKAEFTAGAVGAVAVYTIAAALGVAPGIAANTIIGQPSSTAQMRPYASAVGTGGLTYLKRANAVNELIEFDFVQPVILEPGRGINLTQAVQNIALAASFQFSEESL